MITFIIIVVVIIILASNSSEKKKSYQQTPLNGMAYKGQGAVSSSENMPSTLQSSNATDENTIHNVEIKGKLLSKTQRILNLVSNDNLIHSFSCHNGNVLIRMQNGYALQGPLNCISVDFGYSGSTKQRQATVSFNRSEVKIYEVDDAMSQQDYDTLFAVLSYAGHVNGLYYITPEGMAQANHLAQMKSMQQTQRNIQNQRMWNNIFNNNKYY